MKGKMLFLLILCIIVIDQALKIYVKSHFYCNQSQNVLGNWFQLNFVENDGMAWGWKLGGDWGKLTLTIFRLLAVFAGTFILINDLCRRIGQLD